MPYVETAARVLLGVVFAAAFLSKARGGRSFAAFSDSLREFGVVSGALRPVLAAAVAGAEGAVAVALAVPVTAAAGLAGAGALLALFTAATALALRRGRRPVCNCFGSSGAVLGASQLARNCLLIAVAVAGVICWALASGQAAVSTPGAVLVAGLAVLAGLGAAAWNDLAQLMAPAGSPRR